MLNYKNRDTFYETPKELEEFANKHPILLRVCDARVFSIEYDKGKYLISEQCDNYYEYVPSKQDCLALSKMFTDLAKLIKE